MTTKETITLNNVSDVQLPGIMFRYIRNDCSGVFGIRAQLRRNMQKRLRIGSIHIIFRYDEDNNLLILSILDIGNRDDIYK